MMTSTPVLVSRGDFDAPAGSVVLRAGNNGRGQFTSLSAMCVFASVEAAADFVAALPKAVHRCVSVVPGGVVTSVGRTEQPTALVQFFRFVALALEAGFTPVAFVVPVERRGAVGGFAEVDDIRSAFASVL